MRGESTSLRYASYLLRLWQEQDEQTTLWRFSLDDPRTGERFGFADVETLLRFLNEQMAAAAAAKNANTEAQ